MRKIILILTLGLLGSYSLSASSYEEGIEAYSSADYAKAIELFTRALEEGPRSAETYYNLGAAYYKHGDIAPALLNFHRAYRLDPSDPDIRYNLKFLNTQIVDDMEPSPTFFFNRMLSTMSHWFGLATWRFIGFIGIALAFAGVFLYLRGKSITTRRWGFYGGIVMILIALTAHTLAYKSYRFTHDSNEAILMASIVTVKSSPDASAKDIVVVHSGLKIETLQHLAGFTEVRLPDGTIGWVPQDSYEIINNFSNNSSL